MRPAIARRTGTNRRTICGQRRRCDGKLQARRHDDDPEDKAQGAERGGGERRQHPVAERQRHEARDQDQAKLGPGDVAPTASEHLGGVYQHENADKHGRVGNGTSPVKPMPPIMISPKAKPVSVCIQAARPASASNPTSAPMLMSDGPKAGEEVLVAAAATVEDRRLAERRRCRHLAAALQGSPDQTCTQYSPDGQITGRCSRPSSRPGRRAGRGRRDTGPGWLGGEVVLECRKSGRCTGGPRSQASSDSSRR